MAQLKDIICTGVARFLGKVYASEFVGNATTATTLKGLTSTITELNYVDGVTSNIQAQLDKTVPVTKGGTGYTSITDTTYTTARYRASSLHSSETNPSANGVIAWTYE